MSHGDGAGRSGGCCGEGRGRGGENGRCRDDGVRTEDCRSEGDGGDGDCRREGGRGGGECCREDEVQSVFAEGSGVAPRDVADTELPVVTTVAVCASGPSLSDVVDERLGRTVCFQLIDPWAMTVEVVSNDENRVSTWGAAAGSAEFFAGRRVQAAIVAKAGSEAADAFRRVAVPLYGAAGMTVGDAVAAFARGGLSRIDNE